MTISIFLLDYLKSNQKPIKKHNQNAYFLIITRNVKITQKNFNEGSVFLACTKSHFFTQYINIIY